MRENRTYGSEGGEGPNDGPLSYPYLEEQPVLSLHHSSAIRDVLLGSSPKQHGSAMRYVSF